jgi:hypothetical protein
MISSVYELGQECDRLENPPLLLHLLVTYKLPYLCPFTLILVE